MGSETGIFIRPSKKDRERICWHSRRFVHDLFLLLVFSVNIFSTDVMDGLSPFVALASSKRKSPMERAMTLLSMCSSKFLSDLMKFVLHKTRSPTSYQQLTSSWVHGAKL